MKIEDVFALSNAGFSQEQIIALTKFIGNPSIDNKNVVVEPQVVKPAEVVPAEPPKVVPEPVAEPVAEPPKQTVNNFDPVLDEIKKLVSSVQQSNINTAQNTMPKTESADDIIASIIRPPKI